MKAPGLPQVPRAEHGAGEQAAALPGAAREESSWWQPGLCQRYADMSAGGGDVTTRHVQAAAVSALQAEASQTYTPVQIRYLWQVQTHRRAQPCLSPLRGRGVSRQPLRGSLASAGLLRAPRPRAPAVRRASPGCSPGQSRVLLVGIHCGFQPVGCYCWLYGARPRRRSETNLPQHRAT